MTQNQVYHIVKIITKKSPYSAVIFIGVGLFIIFLEIVALGISIDAILSIAVNDDHLGSKAQFLLTAIGFDMYQTPIFFYSATIFLIYAFLIVFRYLRRELLIMVKRKYLEQCTVDLSKDETLENIKQVKLGINKVENTLNLAVFGIFCGILIVLLMVLDMSLAIILILMGIIHVTLNLFLKNINEQKNSKTDDNKYIRSVKQKQLSENNTDISALRSLFWDDYLKKSTKNAHQIALNNMIRGLSLVAVLVDLHIEGARVIAVYPILMVFILGRFHQYLDALSSNLRRVKS